MTPVYLTGLLTGLALIVAIGAQNAFLLRQGIRGEHVGKIVAICLASDIVAISLATAGVGALIEAWPPLLTIAKFAGGLYLIAFGISAAVRAWKPDSLEASAGTAMTTRTAILTTLALTWLNPHFYLDVILMLGTVANNYGDLRWVFALGACTASVLWFFGLGYGARLLRRFFARPMAWRVLDSSIAVVMGALGVSLLAQ